MKSLKSIAIALCAALVVSCGMNNTGKGALIGAGGGAALGAIVGALAGNTAIGAAVGGAVGAGAGAIIGKKMDKAKAEAEAVQNAQVEAVTDANGLEAVKVTFDSGILFTTGSSTLSSTAKTSLFQFANVLKNNADCDVACSRIYRQCRMEELYSCPEPAEESGALSEACPERNRLSAPAGCQLFSDPQHDGLWRVKPCG